ncbi:MAG: hypothetical protein JXQ73_08705 [Phycisphaerae bacterium]|nr:hypothetical protein [Phycisphaerae bacterium]
MNVHDPRGTAKMLSVAPPYDWVVVNIRQPYPNDEVWRHFADREEWVDYLFERITRVAETAIFLSLNTTMSGEPGLSLKMSKKDAKAVQQELLGWRPV